MHKCVNNTVGNVYHLEQMVDNFFPYSQKQLGFDKGATIVFQSDQDNAGRMLGKTAYYDPENFQVVLYTDGRHPKDILRSLSHELVHHAQNCRGDFTRDNPTYEGYAQKDPHLREMEREAYEKGNLIFRDFEDLIKTGKIDVEIDFSETGEPKMSLKEWKNNEINTKLMKKWGLLSEAAKPDFLDLDKDGDKEEPMKDAAKDAKEKDLDEAQLSEEEIEEIRRGREYYDKMTGPLGTVHRNQSLDPSDYYRLQFEKDPAKYAMRGMPGGGSADDEDYVPADHIPGALKGIFSDDPEDRMSDEEYDELELRRQGEIARRRKAFADQFKEGKTPKMISVHEAKQITRRILERVRKESK